MNKVINFKFKLRINIIYIIKFYVIELKDELS